MDQAKFEAFIAAAIKKTKEKSISWRRVDLTMFTHETWANYDMHRSFMCAYAQGRMLLVCKKNSDTYYCLISPDATAPFQRVVGADADDSAALVLRLYNLVYSLFPSVDSFVDAMINSTDDLEAPSDSETLPF